MAKNGEQSAKGKKNLALIIAIIVAVLIIAIMAVLLIRMMAGGDGEEEFSDDFFDPFAQTGILPDMSEEEIQAELNRVVEEGMLNVSIAGRIIFEDGESEGKANIVNSEANHYIQKVALTLDSTGETLYESGGIKPGQYIQYISLVRKLDPGDYAATAVFTAYTEEERQVVGSASARVTIIVKK